MNDNLQRTAEWFKARLGCLTASVAADAISRGSKGQKLAGYQKRIETIVAERLTGASIPLFQTPAMQWGTDHEGEAIKEYEIRTGNTVSEVGFIKHPEIEWLGASPDGLVGNDGLIEVKCPDTTTHIRRYIDGVVPEDRKPQMLVQLLCTGRKYCDFIDYDPRLSSEYAEARIFIARFEPTAEELEEAKARCIEFLNDVQKTIEKFPVKKEVNNYEF